MTWTAFHEIPPPARRAGWFARLVGAWEWSSSILTAALGVRFLSAGHTGADPFASGLFAVFGQIVPSPTFWGLLMVLALPGAVVATLCAGAAFRLTHRVWLTAWWFFAAGASISIGLDRTLQTFGVLLLWGLAVVALCQTYAYLDYVLRAGLFGDQRRP